MPTFGTDKSAKGRLLYGRGHVLTNELEKLMFKLVCGRCYLVWGRFYNSSCVHEFKQSNIWLCC